MMTRTILCGVLTLLTTATTASAQSEWYGAYAGFNVRGGYGKLSSHHQHDLHDRRLLRDDERTGDQ